MKEALEHDLITLAIEILANEGEWDLAQLNKQAHKITEKITILNFVEKYYQTLEASEDRMFRTMRKVSDFIDDNRQEDLFDIEVEASEVHPITAPKPVAKQILQEENLLEPKWTVPANRSQVAESTKPIETPQLVETPQPIQASPAAFEIEQPAIEQPEIEKPEINESKPSKSAIKQLADFIQQPEYTDEERILKQTPSLEEFISKSKHTVFDKKDADEEVKPAQSLNDKFGKTAQIGLNDKLAFVQKLFFGSESEYNKVVKHIANLHSMQDAVIYIEQEVKPTYNYWKGKEEYEQRFLDLLLKRFEV